MPRLLEPSLPEPRGLAPPPTAAASPRPRPHCHVATCAATHVLMSTAMPCETNYMISAAKHIVLVLSTLAMVGTILPWLVSSEIRNGIPIAALIAMLACRQCRVCVCRMHILRLALVVICAPGAPDVGAQGLVPAHPACGSVQAWDDIDDIVVPVSPCPSRCGGMPCVHGVFTIPTCHC